MGLGLDQYSALLEEMAKAGLHFGRKVSRKHPKMSQFISSTRNSINIIDLEQTSKSLDRALDFIKELVANKGVLLFVGTRIQHKAMSREVAETCGFPYVSDRWIGGTLTNFENIKKRIAYFNELQKKMKEGGFDKHTKKERLMISRELADLEIKFGGIRKMEKLPEAIFVIDMQKDLISIKGAKLKGIKVIAISNTDNDPSLADYPIFANNGAVSSVKYILDKIEEVILKAKKLQPKDAKPETKKTEVEKK